MRNSCRGESSKGKKLGLKDPRNFLFREYLDLVEVLQPDVFVIENVKGLLLSANGWFKDEIIQTIEKLGYYVNVDVLNAADFGVPQSRERAIFICSKQMPISLPKPTVSKRTTVRDAIEDLAYLNSGEGAYEQEYITEAKSLYQVQSRKGSDKLYNHNPLIGERAQTIAINSQEALFEIIGYMATPGRITSIEAEVPRDGRDKIFENMFPGQKYRPIEMGGTPSGLPNKLGSQFRINFGNLCNCPQVLKQNMGTIIRKHAVLDDYKIFRNFFLRWSNRA